MDWAEVKARNILQISEMPPCDCVEYNKKEEWAFSRCYCDNMNDAAETASWCTEKNLINKIAQAFRELLKDNDLTKR
jgi:hypothetical protein